MRALARHTRPLAIVLLILSATALSGCRWHAFYQGAGFILNVGGR